MMLGRIDGATRRLGRPTDMDESECGSLHIRDVVLDNGRNVMVSAWIPTPDEVKAIAAGGTIHLCVFGVSHPPVAILVEPARG